MIRWNLFKVSLYLLLSCVHSGITLEIDNVELIWGIGEVETPIGKLFNFTIPKDAFAGDIKDIKVTEVGKLSLPSWLTFNPKAHQFLGLPVLTKDIHAHYITVRIFGKGHSHAEDVFTVIVHNDEATPTECKSETSPTILTLILDVDWDTMTFTNQMELLSKLSSYLDIEENEFKVSLITESGTLFDSTALIAGPGNSKNVSYPGIKLSAIVGCNGNVNNKELITFVEESAREGAMAKFTRVNIVGWTLTTSKPTPSRRVRRESNYLNTPEPSPIMPTMPPQRPGVQPTPYLGGARTNTVTRTASSQDEIRPTSPGFIVTPTAGYTDGPTPELGSPDTIIEARGFSIQFPANFISKAIISLPDTRNNRQCLESCLTSENGCVFVQYNLDTDECTGFSAEVDGSIRRSENMLLLAVWGRKILLENQGSIIKDAYHALVGADGKQVANTGVITDWECVRLCRIHPGCNTLYSTREFLLQHLDEKYYAGYYTSCWLGWSSRMPLLSDS